MSHNPHFDHRNMHPSSDGDETSQTPRRPMPETERRMRDGRPTAALPPPMKSNMSRSTLSVNAPEFVPMGFSFPNQGISYPPPGLLLSAGATEFVPRTIPPNVPPNMGPPLQQVPPPHLPPGAAGGVGDQFADSFGQMNLGNGRAGGGRGGGDRNQMGLLEEFATTMVTLTMHPANLRDFLLPLCDKLRQARTPDILEQVIAVLYEQSIYEPNFRYTGARVCHFLCDELKNHPVFGEFRSKFLTKCQQDYSKREQLMKGGENGMNTLCGLTLFMGELFLNVTVDGSGKSERLEFLPNAMTDLLLTLLSVPSDRSVKTACQLLKLAGGLTEDSMLKKGTHEMQNFNSIFLTLDSLQAVPNISQNMKMLMKSVLTLRQNNWGRPDSRAHNPGDNSPANSVPPPDFSQSEPVFYNQFGKPITREEAGYKEEEEEETYEDYELTEEEEREFLIWQEETNTHHERLAPTNHSGHRMTQPGYGDGAMYQQWSTADSNHSYHNYNQNYDYNSYQPYGEDEGFNDEMEKAYEEFLSSQRGPPMGK